jgi:hypothetical protein
MGGPFENHHYDNEAGEDGVDPLQSLLTPTFAIVPGQAGGNVVTVQRIHGGPAESFAKLAHFL